MGGTVEGVRTSISGALCFRCRPPDPESLRVRLDSCYWRSGRKSDCESDEVLVGGCIGDKCPSLARCCVVQPNGCATAPHWHRAVQSQLTCKAQQAVVAACGADCSPCLLVSQNNGGMFCQGLYMLGPAIAPICSAMPECPPHHLLVSYQGCSDGVRTTSATCAPLRAGKIVSSRCLILTGDRQVWCPKGYAAIAICGPPFPKSCLGGHTTILKCCFVEQSTTTTACTAFAGLYPVAGNPTASSACAELQPPLAIDASPGQGEGLLGIPFNAPIYDITFNKDRNLLFALVGEKMVQLPVSKFYENQATIQDVALVGPTGAVTLDRTQMFISEGRGLGASVKALSVAASERRWFTDINVGSAQGVTTQVFNGSLTTSPVTAVRAVAYLQNTQELFLSSLEYVFVVRNRRIYYFAGNPASPMEDNRFRTETRFSQPERLLTVRNRWLLVADPSARVLRYIELSSGFVQRLLGSYGSTSSSTIESCSATPSKPPRAIVAGSPQGMAVYRDETLYVADATETSKRRMQ